MSAAIPQKRYRTIDPSGTTIVNSAADSTVTSGLGRSGLGEATCCRPPLAALLPRGMGAK